VAPEPVPCCRSHRPPTAGRRVKGAIAPHRPLTESPHLDRRNRRERAVGREHRCPGNDLFGDASLDCSRRPALERSSTCEARNLLLFGSMVSLLFFGFSTIWGVCFSLKGKSHHSKASLFDTVLIRSRAGVRGTSMRPTPASRQDQLPHLPRGRDYRLPHQRRPYRGLRSTWQDTRTRKPPSVMTAATMT
jgi:hypothetical protein